MITFLGERREHSTRYRGVENLEQKVIHEQWTVSRAKKNVGRESESDASRVKTSTESAQGREGGPVVPPGLPSVVAPGTWATTPADNAAERR